MEWGGKRKKVTLMWQQEDMFDGAAQSFAAEQSGMNSFQNRKTTP